MKQRGILAGRRKLEFNQRLNGKKISGKQRKRNDSTRRFLDPESSGSEELQRPRLSQYGVDLVEQCGTGGAYCQIIDSIYSTRATSPWHASRWPRNLNRNRIQGEEDRQADPGGRPNQVQDAWMKKFWDANYSGELTTTASAAARVGGGRTPVTGHRSTAPSGTAMQVQALQGQVHELTAHLEGLERERDFYLEKLRDIEMLVQAKFEDLEAAGAADDETMQKILYSTEEGFEVPEGGAIDEETIASGAAQACFPGSCPPPRTFAHSFTPDSRLPTPIHASTSTPQLERLDGGGTAPVSYRVVEDPTGIVTGGLGVEPWRYQAAGLVPESPASRSCSAVDRDARGWYSLDAAGPRLHLLVPPSRNLHCINPTVRLGATFPGPRNLVALLEMNAQVRPVQNPLSSGFAQDRGI
ncbi:hypothetical protein FB451DRAFT_1478437 [Mycena latifolia]|nr:hypothetical protein FB451DRAFT_1478437 [Mycena latifolia]